MTVAELRRETNLSQQQFADLFEIPVRTLQQWEQGRSNPPAYVLSMMKQLLARDHMIPKSAQHRHVIPARRTWRICIDNPFEQCQRIYPIQQWKIRELIDDISRDSAVESITIFGSSVTERCHQGSDVDLYVELTTDHNPVQNKHDFAFDLWTNFTADERLKTEILKKGVKVYDRRTNAL